MKDLVKTAGKNRLLKKILLTMKLTTVFLMFGLVSVTASTYSQSTRLDVQIKDGTLVDLIQEIEKNSEFFFFYQKEDLKNLDNITLEVNNGTIMDILDKALDGTQFNYSVLDRYIVVRKKGDSFGDELLSSTHAVAIAQQRAVSGTVTDAGGLPLPGVTVIVKGSTQGTVTNANGNYTIPNVPQDATLLFSFVGMRTQEVVVGNQTNINVSMQEEAIGLEEVVAVGYTTQRRKDISGSISIVDVDGVVSGPAPEIGKQLQGRAAGVTVIGSGQPGQEASVRIRGISTFGNNDPLYIIDGVPTQSIQTLSPNDIESLQILKDASAASIYGSRASNGVIIITTKKGKRGTQVNYDAFIGYEVPKENNVWDVLSPQEMAELKWLAIENSGGNPRPDPLYGNGPIPVLPDYIRPQGAKFGEVNEDDYYLVPHYTGGINQLNTFNQITRANKEGTDWYAEIVRPALTTSNNLSVSSGGESGNFFLSLNHLNQEGTVIETYHNRTTFRINSQFNVNKNFRIGENFTLSMRENPTISSSQTSAIGMSYTQQPIIPVYDIAGNFAGPWGIGSGYNPVAEQVRSRDNISKNSRLLGNVYAELDFFKVFTYRTSFGGHLNFGRSRNFTYPTYERAENRVDNMFEASSSYGFNLLWTNTLTYNQKFNDVHTVGILLGSEAYKEESGNVGGTTQDYFSFNPDFTTLSSGSGIKTNYSSVNKRALLSYFGKADYNYKDKYLLSGTLRYDGSSAFIGDNRWGMFPAGSIAWRISEESFMDRVSWLYDLKLRAGYGILGNQLNVSTDNPHTLFAGNINNSYYAIDGSNNSVQLGFRQARIGNPDARWEKNVSGNIGVDASLFRDKIEIIAEYYWKDINDLLYNVTLPATMGMASVPSVNVGHIQNRGVDLSILTRGSKNEFRYDAMLTFTAYRNKIVYIADGIDFFGGSTNYNKVGSPMNSFYGYKIAGFWQSQEEIDAANTLAGGTYQNAMKVGRYRYEDTDNNNIINADDRVIIGDPHPDFTSGLDINLYYLNFDFNIFMYSSVGNKIFAYWHRYLDFYPFLEGAKSRAALYDSWTPENPNAKLPIQEVNQTFSSSAGDTDYFVEDGSYLRVKNVILGYTIPSSLTQRIGISKLRFYGRLSNPLTFTKYSGRDPEVFGMDDASYANNRHFHVGVNLTF